MVVVMNSTRELWIIDGHNVIFAVDVLEDLQLGGKKREARDTLSERCRAFAAAKNAEVVLVFDGVPGYTEGAEPGPGLEIVFEAHGDKADGRILLRAEQAGRRKVRVVTGDRGLIERLPSGVVVVSSQAFWNQLWTRKRKESKEPFQAPDIEQHFLDVEDETLKNLDTKRPQTLKRNPGARFRREQAVKPLPEGDQSGRADSQSGRTASQSGGIPPRSGHGAPQPDRVYESHVPEVHAPKAETKPDPIVDWREELAKKKERGKRKQANRLNRRKR